MGTPLSALSALFQLGTGVYVSHAGSGITDAYFTSWQSVSPLWKLAREKNWHAAVSFAPAAIRQEKELWLRSSEPGSSNGFAIMGRLKQMFDPANLLNRSRLYGCL